MGAVNLRDQAVLDRSIADTDIIVSAARSQPDAALAFSADTALEYARSVLTGRLPTDLTPDEQAALQTAFDLYSRATIDDLIPDGGIGTPSTLVDEADVDQTPTSHDLGEVIDTSCLYEFRVTSDPDDNGPDGYAIISGARLNILTLNSSVPTTPNNSVGLKIVNSESDTALTSFGHGTINVWGGSDRQRLYAAIPRVGAGNIHLSIVKLPIAAGPQSSQQQSSGGGRARHDFLGDTTSVTLPLNAYSTAFNGSTVVQQTTFAGVPKADLISLDFVIRVQTRFAIPIHIDRPIIDHIGFLSSYSWSWTTNGDELPCAYWHGENSTTGRREAWVVRPSFWKANTLRQASTPAFLIFLLEDGDDFIGYAIHCSSSVALYLREAVVTYEASV